MIQLEDETPDALAGAHRTGVIAGGRCATDGAAGAPQGVVTSHTGAERQRRRRERLEQAGLAQCSLWVPVACLAELQQQAELLRAFPHLLPGPLRDPISGRLVSARSPAGRRLAADPVLGAIATISPADAVRR